MVRFNEILGHNLHDRDILPRPFHCGGVRHLLGKYLPVLLKLSLSSLPRSPVNLVHFQWVETRMKPIEASGGGVKN